MIKYRVILNAGYYGPSYEFDNAEEAGQFASTALLHRISLDGSSSSFMTIETVDTEKDKEEDDE